MDDNKFVKEVDTVLDKKKLNTIFELPDQKNLPEKINEMKKELQSVEKEIEENNIDSDEILNSNIERANRFLDIVERELEEGRVKGVLLEAAASLINGITSAANSIVGSSYNDDQTRLKEKALELKEKELFLKQSMNEKKGDKSTNIFNTIMTDRESLLEMIKEQQQSKKD
jgi:hypothetical protein